MWDSLSKVNPADTSLGTWPYGYNEPWAVMHKAIEKGCVNHLFTCWSCPGWMKTNGRIQGGGHLLPEHYQDFADMVAQHFVYFHEEGFTQDKCKLFFSPTNEPNAVEWYQSMEWTGKELLDFTKYHLGPALAPLDVKIILGEKQWWADPEVFETLDDPISRDMIYAVAAHGYLYDKGGDPDRPLQNAAIYKKRSWQTEVCALVSNLPNCPGDIEDGISWGRHMHRLLVNSHVSAYLWWWGTNYIEMDDGEALLCANGEARKLLYVLGNYSRFIRPGYYRIDAEGSTEEILASAYKDLASGKFAIVVINTSPSDCDLNITLNGFSAKTIIPWITSDTKNLEADTEIDVGTSFRYTAKGLSATTFSGTGPSEVDINTKAEQQKVSTDNAIKISGNILTLPDRFVGKIKTVGIYALNGKLIRRIDILYHQAQIHISLNNLPYGTYLVEMQYSGFTYRTALYHLSF
jgi:glucuronoarabinoxylan endo-1,4-beta-xylanase